MSANPLAWMAALWSTAVAQFGEWAYIGAAYGVFTLVFGGLLAAYVRDHQRARAAAKGGRDAL